MRRRAYLASVGVTAVAGCFGGDGGDGTSTTTQTTTSTTTSTTTTTTTSTTTAAFEGATLQFGAWWALEHHSVVVDRVRVVTTLDDVVHRRTVEMPEGEALAIVELRMKNTSSLTRDAIPGSAFGVVVDGEVRSAVSSFPHPGVEGEFELWWLRFATERKLLPLDGGSMRLAPGGFRPVWVAAPVPQDDGDIGAAFDVEGDGKYEIRWVRGG